MSTSDKNIRVTRRVQEVDMQTGSIRVVCEEIELGSGVNAGIRGRKGRRNLNRSLRSRVDATLGKMTKTYYAGGDVHEMDDIAVPVSRRTLGRRHADVRRVKEPTATLDLVIA